MYTLLSCAINLIGRAINLKGNLLRIVIFTLLLFNLSACQLIDNSIKGSASILEDPSNFPTQVTLLNDKPLINLQLNPGYGNFTVGSSTTRNDAAAIAPPLAGVTTGSSGIVPTISGAVGTANSSSVDYQDITNLNLSSGYQINFSVTIQPQIMENLICSLLGELSMIPCSQDGFSLSNLNFAGENVGLELSFNENSVLSNSLAINQYSVRQFAAMESDSTEELYSKFFIFSNKLYMIYNSGVNDDRILVYDGTNELFYTEIDRVTSQFNSFFYESTIYNDKIFIVSFVSFSADKLFSLNPGVSYDTISNTSNVLYNCHDWVSDLTVNNNKLFFSGYNQNSACGSGSKYTKLFSYDDINNTLEQRVNINGDNTSDNILEITNYNNKLFFLATNTSGGLKLFSFADSTNTLTEISNSVNDATQTDFPNFVFRLYVYNNKLFI